MSTTFAIKGHNGKQINIAHRHNVGKGAAIVSWLNSLAPYLPLDTPVFPTDNTAQGVETLADLIKINERYEEWKKSKDL